MKERRTVKKGRIPRGSSSAVY